MLINLLCDYIDGRVDAIDAAVARGEWSDSMREELSAIAGLLHEAFELMM